MSKLRIWQIPEADTIVTTRVVNAPQARVFKAWTDPTHLQNWWGPAGFTTFIDQYDLEPGGKWLFAIEAADRTRYPNECTFVQIDPPAGLVWNHEGAPHEFQVEALFERLSADKTRVIFKMKFSYSDECRRLRAIITEKNEENMDKLEAELARMTH